jgi:stage II sporulation protein D
MAGAVRWGHAPPVPLHAALEHAALRTGPFTIEDQAAAVEARSARLTTRPRHRGRSLGQSVLLIALAAAALMLLLTSTDAFGATLVTPKCDNVNLRTGPATTYARKTQVDIGARLTVVSKVDGGSYSTQCAGAQSGHYWYKLSAINGKTIKSLYGVTYLYAAHKLFKMVVSATPAPSPTRAVAPLPTASPTKAPTPAPTVAPTAVPTAAPAPLPPGAVALGDTVTFYGRGYGHGIGLSQYGAQGRAAAGQTAGAILAHYYQGTTLGTLTNQQTRVLVLESFAATASNPVQVYGRGGSWTIDGISKTFPADARLRFTPATSGTATTWKVTVTATDGSTLYDAASTSSIRVRPAAGTTLQLWSKPSAYDRFRGVLRLIGKTDASARVNVVNELLLESYLRGVVPAEVPATWPVEAVKAQAIAARSYAAYHLHPSTGTYDLYADTRSQMYQGYLVEQAASDSAVSATAGVVLRTPAGGIANALFHSTGGGATENNENVFTSSTGEVVLSGYSYLRGSSDRRPDGSPYDAASPYATWSTKTYTLAQVQAWFAADARTNVGTLVALKLSDRGVSGRLISVTLIGADGSTKQVSSDIFRAVFNANRPSADRMMRSTLFDLAPIP